MERFGQRRRIFIGKSFERSYKCPPFHMIEGHRESVNRRMEGFMCIIASIRF